MKPKIWPDFNEEGRTGHYCIAPNGADLVAVTCGSKDGAKQCAATMAYAPDTMKVLDELVNYSDLVRMDINDQNSGWYYQFQAAIQKANRHMREVREAGEWRNANEQETKP